MKPGIAQSGKPVSKAAGVSGVGTGKGREAGKGKGKRTGAGVERRCRVGVRTCVGGGDCLVDKTQKEK